MGQPPPDVDGAARVVFRFVQHGEERANVLHVMKATDWTKPELQTLADDMLQAWTDEWRTRSVDDMMLVDVTTTSLIGNASEQAVAPCTINCAGTAAAAPAPGNATSTLSWRTSGIGRSKRGRTYVAGWSEAMINDDDTIASFRLTELAIIAITLFAQAQGVSGARLAVFSRVLEAVTPIIATVLENVLDSMRRRLPKRGR